MSNKIGVNSWLFLKFLSSWWFIKKKQPTNVLHIWLRSYNCVFRWPFEMLNNNTGRSLEDFLSKKFEYLNYFFLCLLQIQKLIINVKMVFFALIFLQCNDKWNVLIEMIFRREKGNLKMMSLNHNHAPENELALFQNQESYCSHSIRDQNECL